MVCLPFPEKLCMYERCKFYNLETGNCTYKDDPPVDSQVELLRDGYEPKQGEVAYLLKDPLERFPSWMKLLPVRFQYNTRLSKFNKLEELVDEYLKITIR